jgi:hypothetical protein
MDLSMATQDLKELIKASMREVLREERLLLCQALIPYIDDIEQAKMEAEFASPADYEEEVLTDMSDWVRDGN